MSSYLLRAHDKAMDCAMKEQHALMQEYTALLKERRDSGRAGRRDYSTASRGSSRPHRQRREVQLCRQLEQWPPWCRCHDAFRCLAWRRDILQCSRQQLVQQLSLIRTDAEIDVPANPPKPFASCFLRPSCIVLSVSGALLDS